MLIQRVEYSIKSPFQYLVLYSSLQISIKWYLIYEIALILQCTALITKLDV